MGKQFRDVVRLLRSHADPRNVEGMRRYGITAGKAFGVSAPALRRIAKKFGKDHKLALQLWRTGILDVRVVAALIDEPEKVTRNQMERWVRDFDNWAICDTCCGSLFDKTPFAYEAALEWSKRKEEFVRRAGFAMMAWLAVHDKKADDKKFYRFLSRIKGGSTDERNFVKKAVNWALRQIGKRNMQLNRAAIATARRIRRRNSSGAKWIASDALRELTSEAVRKRLQKRKDHS